MKRLFNTFARARKFLVIKSLLFGLWGQAVSPDTHCGSVSTPKRVWQLFRHDGLFQKNLDQSGGQGFLKRIDRDFDQVSILYVIWVTAASGEGGF
jgi:hypothetical protein